MDIVTILETDASTARLILGAPEVLEFELGRRLSIEVAEAMTKRVSAMNRFKLGGLTAFHDWSAVTSYDTSARIHLTTWLLANRKHFTAVHVLSDDRMVAMGVTVANGLLGGFITAHASRASYEEARAAAIG